MHKIICFEKNKNPEFIIHIIAKSYFSVLNIVNNNNNSDTKLYLMLDKEQICLYANDSYMNLLRNHTLDKLELIKKALFFRLNILEDINNKEGLKIEKDLLKYHAYRLLLLYKYPIEQKVEDKLYNIPLFFNNFRKYYIKIKDPKLDSFLKYTKQTTNDYMNIPNINYLKFISEEEDYITYLVYGFLKDIKQIPIRQKELERINLIKQINYNINFPIITKEKYRNYIDGICLNLFNKNKVLDKIKNIITKTHGNKMKDYFFKKYFCIGLCYDFYNNIKLLDFVTNLKTQKISQSIIHGDLHLGNIIYNIKDDKLYLIDFEYVHKGYLEEDLASLYCDLLITFDEDSAKKYLNNKKYDKNLLFIEIIIRFINIFKANKNKKYLVYLDSWANIYENI